VRKRVDLGGLVLVPIDPAEAGEGVDSIDVHGTRSTDSLPARPTESESRIDLVLNLDQRIEDCRREKRERERGQHEAGRGREGKKRRRRRKGKGRGKREDELIGPVAERSSS